MQDFILAKPHVFKAKDNDGKDIFVVKGQIQNADKRKRDLNPPTFTCFPRTIPGFISTLRELLPKTGEWTDDEGEKHEWLGLKTLEEGKTFGPMEFREVERFMFDEGYTDFNCGIWRRVPTPFPVIQFYSRDLGHVKNSDGSYSQTEALYKKGDPVCYKGTKTVKVYTELDVFCRLEKEGVDYRTDIPLSKNWGWAARLEEVMSMYYPLSEFLKNKEAGRYTDYDIDPAWQPNGEHKGDTFDPDKEGAPET